MNDEVEIRVSSNAESNQLVLDYIGIGNRTEAEEELKKLVSDVLKEKTISWSKQFPTIPVKAEKLILNMGKNMHHDKIMELKGIIEYSTDWKVEIILESCK